MGGRNEQAQRKWVPVGRSVASVKTIRRIGYVFGKPSTARTRGFRCKQVWYQCLYLLFGKKLRSVIIHYQDSRSICLWQRDCTTKLCTNCWRSNSMGWSCLRTNLYHCDKLGTVLWDQTRSFPDQPKPNKGLWRTFLGQPLWQGKRPHHWGGWYCEYTDEYNGDKDTVW